MLLLLGDASRKGNFGTLIQAPSPPLRRPEYVELKCPASPGSSLLTLALGEMLSDTALTAAPLRRRNGWLQSSGREFYFDPRNMGTYNAGSDAAFRFTACNTDAQMRHYTDMRRLESPTEVHRWSQSAVRRVCPIGERSLDRKLEDSV